MNKADYFGEIERQLGDSQCYEKLESNPIGEITMDINFKLTEWKEVGLLSEQEYRYLRVDNPRFPIIYILPKVHKKGGFPPGRPIISGVGSPMENLS